MICLRCKSDDVIMESVEGKDCMFCNFCGYEQRSLVNDLEDVNRIARVRNPKS